MGGEDADRLPVRGGGAHPDRARDPRSRLAQPRVGHRRPRRAGGGRLGPRGHGLHAHGVRPRGLPRGPRGARHRRGPEGDQVLSAKRGNGRDKPPAVREEVVEAPAASPSEATGDDPGEGALTAVEDAAPAAATPTEDPEVLRRERDTLREQLLRRRAEFENFKKRVERDRSQAAFEAAAAIFRELVPTVDNLERALASGADEDTLRQGVELSYRGLLNLLEGPGGEGHDPVGRPFDPRIHQA